jgi:hypothetical protein
MGPNALWLMESLIESMVIKRGMRVLDLGCGKAMTSIFLAKELGAEVWATDLWIEASANQARIRDAGVEDRISAASTSCAPASPTRTSCIEWRLVPGAISFRPSAVRDGGPTRPRHAAAVTRSRRRSPRGVGGRRSPPGILHRLRRRRAWSTLHGRRRRRGRRGGWCRGRLFLSGRCRFR